MTQPTPETPPDSVDMAMTKLVMHIHLAVAAFTKAFPDRTSVYRLVGGEPILDTAQTPAINEDTPSLPQHELVVQQADDERIVRGVSSIAKSAGKFTVRSVALEDKASSHFLSIVAGDDADQPVASVTRFAQVRTDRAERYLETLEIQEQSGRLLRIGPQRIPIESADVANRISAMIMPTHEANEALHTLLRVGVASSLEIDGLMKVVKENVDPSTRYEDHAMLLEQISGYAYRLMHSRRQPHDPEIRKNVILHAYEAITATLMERLYNPNGELG